MPNIYVIDFTDPSTAGFTIKPGQLDGPTGTVAHTDLRLYGEGHLQWGEGVHENFVHMLENFACPDASGSTNSNPLPENITNPVIGQLWYSKDRKKIHYYNGTKWVAVSRDAQQGTSAPTDPSDGDFWWDTDATERNLYIYIDGQWRRMVADYLLRDGTKPMAGILNMGSHRITNVSTPTANNDAVNKTYVDTADQALQAEIDTKVDRAGDTMTGTLIIQNGALAVRTIAGQYINSTPGVAATLETPAATCLRIKCTAAAGDGSPSPGISIYNPDNDPLVGGVDGTRGWTILTPRDGSVVQIEANDEDVGTNWQGSHNVVCTIGEYTTGNMIYLGLPGNTLGVAQNDIRVPNATFSSSDSVVTKQYVDAIGSNLSNNYWTRAQSDDRYVNIYGDQMTGYLGLVSDPTNELHAATKRYVDNNVSPKVNRAGDTMTSFLSLHANPTANMHAATKQYVDSTVASAVPPAPPAGVGAGQIWYNMTYARTGNVVYQNTSSTPICVQAILRMRTDRTCKFYIGSSSSPDMLIWHWDVDANNDWDTTTMSCIIPPYWYYKFDNSDNAVNFAHAHTRWYELR